MTQCGAKSPYRHHTNMSHLQVRLFSFDHWCKLSIEQSVSHQNWKHRSRSCQDLYSLEPSWMVSALRLVSLPKEMCEIRSELFARGHEVMRCQALWTWVSWRICSFRGREEQKREGREGRNRKGKKEKGDKERCTNYQYKPGQIIATSHASPQMVVQ